MTVTLDLSGCTWQKSSYSAHPQGECVEVAEAAWRKSSYSASAEGECVEVAVLPGPVAVRDSKNPGGGVLAVPRAAWAVFVHAARGTM